MNDLKVYSTEELNDMKAAAVMEFVNIQVGAFEANFVTTNQTTLYSLYRFAQHHVKDNYGVETKLMAEEWGDHITQLSRADEEQTQKG